MRWSHPLATASAPLVRGTRYRVAKGIIIDADGRESHYIDIIVYDRQCTPLVFNQNGTMYIPAESVHAVLEAKQDLTRANIIYAGKKAASVRRLRRTVGRIVDAWGEVILENRRRLKPAMTKASNTGLPER